MMNLKVLLSIILLCGFSAVVYTANDSSDDDNDETETIAYGWAERDIPDDVPNIDDLPFDIIKFEDWDEGSCKGRIDTSCEYCTDKQKEAVIKFAGLALPDAERFYNIAPKYIEQLLHKFKRSDIQCVYLKTTLSQNGILYDPDDDEVKIGDSGVCKYRVIVQQNGDNTYNFIFMPPEDMVDEGFVGEDVISDIVDDKKILKRLPITGGMYLEDNIGAVISKLTRQIGEMNPTCAYDGIKEGPLMEFFTRSPSKREAKFMDVEWMLDNVENNHGGDIEELYQHIGELDGVHFVGTWTPDGEKRREQEFDKVQLFAHPGQEEGYTPYLAKRNLDKDTPFEFVNAHPECPLHQKLDPIITEIQALMNRQTPTQQEMKQLFDKAPKESYVYPKDQDIADLTKSQLEDIFNDQSYNKKLIVVNKIAIKRIRTYHNDWYKENFPSADTLDISDKKIKKNSDSFLCRR